MFKKIINFINSKIKSSEYYSSPHALLYRRILESSYDNTFYANLKVPDTIDGRFDVIILHIFVFIKIFKNSSDVEKNFTQKLFDIFMIEVESSYREMGISDQSFGKKMKIVIESFYGRTKLYDQYFDDEEEFSRCLLQNIWDNDKERDKESRKLYHFVCQKVNKYKDKSLRDVLIISSRGF
jgi:cytochrome b pre-mRNA-processing protein 3|tara:strand:+ start:89 stop:631 length:543 start_codon:yes stop_codon:yes gene_type:complete